MSSALVPVTKESWDVIQSVAPVVQASRMFGTTVEQAAVVMLKGYELGLGLASSFEYIHVIDSKPSLAPKGALALIQRSGELAGLRIEDRVDDKGAPSECSVWMKRTNNFEYTATFTMGDAERAGLVKKGGGWEKYPANMLRWRAIGYCADIVFPDVTGRMHQPEELGADVDEEGAPIEGVWNVTGTPIITDEPTVIEEASDDPPGITLEKLIAKYGAAAIMEVTGGKIPQDEDELAVAGAALESFERQEAAERAAEKAAEEDATPS